MVSSIEAGVDMGMIITLLTRMCALVLDKLLPRSKDPALLTSHEMLRQLIHLEGHRGKAAEEQFRERSYIMDNCQ